MKKCLVVGGSGFVGRELCRQLIDRGDDVSVLDCLDQSYQFQGKWLKGDITQADTIQTALGDLSFDVIFHVASLPGDTGDPVQMVNVNIIGLTHMLVYARDAKVKRFVLTSSCSAYEWYPATRFNPPDYLPVDEEHPTRPKDMYSSTKRIQEILAMTFYHQYGLPTTALRLTAVVGPDGRGGGRSWRKFAEMLNEAKLVQIPFFTMEERCHFVDIRDVARLQIIVSEHPNAVGEIFNCCGPTPTLGSEFARIVQLVVPGISVECGYPWSMAQGGEIAFDMAKAMKLLGFKPQYTLVDSIRSIKEWCDVGGLKEEGAVHDGSYGSGIRVS